MMMTDGPCTTNQVVCTMQPLCPKISMSQSTIRLVTSPAASTATKRSAYKAGCNAPLAKRPRKRVQFEEHRNTFIAQNEATPPFSPWYHATEYRSFQLEARNTIIAYFQAGGDTLMLDPSQHCLRGLEKHQFPPQARALYKAQNRQFIKLIIGEHCRLRNAGVSDAEKQLHEMSTMYTVPAKTYALHLALSGAD